MATQYTAGLTTQVLTSAIMNSIGATWETWTPTITQGVNVTFTNNLSRYTQIQKLVVAQTYLTVTGAGTANTAVEISLPLTAQSNSLQIMSTGFFYDSSAAFLYTVVGTTASTTKAAFFYTNASGNQWGQSPNVGLAVNDQLRFLFVYEAA